MERLSILGSILLLLFMGVFSSGCIDRAKVCEEAFCIGTLLPEGEVFNGPLIEAVNLAKDDINKAGGNIEIISGNSFQAGAEAGEAIASAARLLELDVRGIVAPSYSSDSKEVHPFLVEKEMVGISPSATSPELTEKNEEIVASGDQIFFFRVSPSDLFQGPILATQAMQSQGNTVIVNRDDTWGENLAEIIEDILSHQRQVEVVSYPSTSPDTAAVVSDVEEAVQRIGNVGSLVILAFTEGGGIIKGLLESSMIPEEVGYYVGDGLIFEDDLFPYVDEENGDVEGFKRVSASPPPGKRLEEFKERFGAGNFNDYTAQAYDAVVILSLAALSAGSYDPSVYVSEIREVTREGTKCHSYATCAAALTDETTTNDDIDYEGFSGPIDLDENGDITDGLYVVDTYDAQGVPEKTYLNFQGEEVNTN